VTGSVEELRGGLALVAEHLHSAHDVARHAGTLIDDAVAILARLSEEHPESLVPVELNRASDELGRTLGLIQSGSVAVADIDARL